MPGEDIAAYEGLVFRTAQMFAELVGLEMDDMRQELRITVVKALRAHSARHASKSKQRGFVYGCVANRVKDMKRDAARRYYAPLTVQHIDDLSVVGFISGERLTEWFEATFASATHDETFGDVDNGDFVMPATVTREEQEILYLLVIGYAQTEIALTLGLEYAEVVKGMRVLREKFADWRPTRVPQELPTPAPVTAQPTAIAA